MQGLGILDEQIVGHVGHLTLCFHSLFGMIQGQSHDHLVFPQGDGVDDGGVDLFRHQRVVVLHHADLRGHLHGDRAGQLQVVDLLGDVIEIDRGILKTGICDALAALRLGIEPTGNGKRENFEHKVYTRMTNTIFDSGSSTLEDMIASVSHGYLLEGMESGMEDPKHWGIQCIIKLGREIRDGKLTGKVVAPIIMTGYVPDLLGNISMLSGDREIFGSGGCAASKL